jgi:formamidopyrimidine-DNA glycosylase
MQQSLIAGLGNIYASEVLWAAGISPFRSGSSLGLADYHHLAVAVDEVLRRAIAAGGATLDDYRGTTGEMGNFDASFAVYSRDGLKCLRCASQILAKALANRVTYWCPGCQS